MKTTISKSEKQFRKNLMGLCLEREISQVQLAKQISMSRPFLNRILRGRSSPSLRTCDKIASSLKVNLSDLISAKWPENEEQA
jgi:transcriptional regulator with XRE-family HTH domain